MVVRPGAAGSGLGTDPEAGRGRGAGDGHGDRRGRGTDLNGDSRKVPLIFFLSPNSNAKEVSRNLDIFPRLPPTCQMGMWPIDGRSTPSRMSCFLNNV